MTEDNGPAKTALEAVRCLYLARVLHRDGHEAAARRWEARALEWTRSMAPDPSVPLDGSEEGPDVADLV